MGGLFFALLPLLAAVAGGISVIYNAAVTAVGQSLGHPIWAIPLAYIETIPVLVVCELLWSRPSSLPVSETVKAVVHHIHRRPGERWPILLGGLLGTLIGLSGAYASPIIGVGQFFVLFVTGQVLAGYIMDKMTASRTLRVEGGASRALGCCLVLSGSFFVQWDAFEVRQGTQRRSKTLCSLASLGAGVAAVVQGSANAQLRAVVESSCRAAIWSMTSGLLVISAAAWCVAPHPDYRQFFLSLRFPQDVWKAFGGMLSLNTLVAVMLLPKYLGYALNMCWMIAGELLLAFFIDQFGLFELKSRPVTPIRVAGLMTVLCGVIAVQYTKPIALEKKWTTRLALHATEIVEESSIVNSTEYLIPSSLETNDTNSICSGISDPICQLL